MPISDLCSRKPVIISGRETLEDAAKLMKKKHIGTVVVCEGDKPLGIVTDRDIVIHVVADGRDPRQVRVKDVMSSGPVTAKEDLGLFEAIHLMEKESVRRLIVIDDEGHLCGLLSTDDLVRMLGQEITEIGNLYASQAKKEAESPVFPH